MSSHLQKEIEDFATAWEEWRDQELSKQYATHQPGGVSLLYSKVWCKIVLNQGVEAFIALEDGENKKLGPWKQGDIFRPDTWSSPAKHKRGSVFDPERMQCMSVYGVKALPASNNGYGAPRDAAYVMQKPA